MRAHVPPPGSAVSLTYSAVYSTGGVLYNTAVISHPLLLNETGATTSPPDTWGKAEPVYLALRGTISKSERTGRSTGLPSVDKCRAPDCVNLFQFRRDKGDPHDSPYESA